MSLPRLRVCDHHRTKSEGRLPGALGEGQQDRPNDALRRVGSSCARWKLQAARSPSRKLSGQRRGVGIERRVRLCDPQVATANSTWVLTVGFVTIGKAHGQNALSGGYPREVETIQLHSSTLKLQM